MNILLYFLVCFGLCTLQTSSQDVTKVSFLHPMKRHNFRASLANQLKSKTFKRSPGNPLFLPSLNGRILNKKTPLNVLQNGPYFINHYIYCDNLDQHTLEQIKSGTFSSDKQFQLFNQQGSKFQGFNGLTPSLDSLDSSSGIGTYTGDKEIHILHLPKNKPHNFDDIKLHLSLMDAHESANLPDIDLDLNKNLGNFEVNLGSIKPPKLDSSLFPTPTTSSLHDVVKPLIQGHIGGGQGHNYNLNLGHLTHYLTENTKAIEGSFNQNSGGYGAGSKEVIDVPHFEQHPLENDPVKASYDTPGATDSYGQPIAASPHDTQTSQFGDVPDLSHLIPNQHQGELSSGFQNSLKNDDFYQPENYINQLNEIHNFHRKRRQEANVQANDDKVSVELPEGSQNAEAERHPNHRYE